MRTTHDPILIRDEKMKIQSDARETSKWTSASINRPVLTKCHTN